MQECEVCWKPGGLHVVDVPGLGKRCSFDSLLVSQGTVLEKDWAGTFPHLFYAGVDKGFSIRCLTSGLIAEDFASSFVCFIQEVRQAGWPDFAIETVEVCQVPLKVVGRREGLLLIAHRAHSHGQFSLTTDSAERLYLLLCHALNDWGPEAKLDLWRIRRVGGA